MATPLFVRLQPGDRVQILADAQKHAYAVEQLQHALATQALSVQPVSALAGTPGVVCLLADASDLPDPLSRELDLPDLRSLGDGGYLVRTTMWKEQPCIVLAGAEMSGVIYAVQDLIDAGLHVSAGSVEIATLDIRNRPALTYRMFWTWDHSTNWYLEQVGNQEIGASNVYTKPRSGFVEDYKRLIDFMSTQRLNGLVIYGFLRDRHGGIEAAKEIARYGRQRGVRIIPGVGINSYGGIYWEGNHKYNLGTWLRDHPELRAQLDRELPFPINYFGELACPSKPANRTYHQEAIQWLCEEFEIGGINFETGDYGVCQCPECTARRTDGDRWSTADSAELYPPLFDAARRANPDLWLIAEAYFDNILDLQALTALAGLPRDTVVQYCINRSYWPRVRAELSADHVAHLPVPINVMRTHMGSQWNNERYSLIARDFADLARLVSTTGMQGMDVFGEVSAFHTANEINYLAYAAFSYDRALTWDRFISEVLAPRLGGTEAAGAYMQLLQTAHAAPELTQAIGHAREFATTRSDAEQYRRWVWLINRLSQAKAML